MWGKAAAIWAALAMPAAATGIEITVAGDANGVIKIDLLEDVAPGHVARIVALAEAGEYDGVVFHRVIPDFMAQTGDVLFGDATSPDYSYRSAGTGGSNLPNLTDEFSDIPFEQGVLGMANKGFANSGNSQFFIMFGRADWLDGGYTVLGRVTEGQDVVNAIKKGHPRSGAMMEGEPDRMVSVVVTE